ASHGLAAGTGTCTAAHAHAPAAVFGFVVQVAPAQAAGVQPVFVGIGGAGDDGAGEIGVAADVDLEAAVAGGQAGDLGDALVVVLHAGGAGVTADADAAARPAVDQGQACFPLLAGEVAGVLLAFQG